MWESENTVLQYEEKKPKQFKGKFSILPRHTWSMAEHEVCVVS
jgi:hypothetical protein